MVKTLKFSLISLTFLILGCSNATDTGTAAGAGVGAGAGAIIGHQSGNAGAGAAIGAVGGGVIGNAAGYAIDQEKKKTEEDKVIELQKRQMEKQQDEIQDLRRQQYYNDRMRRFD